MHEHLGPYSDLADIAATTQPWYPRRQMTADDVRQLLGFDRDPTPGDARVERRWSGDGVDGEEVTWSVGYGPRTRALLLRPAGVTGPVPGVVALHCHGGQKYHGLDKIADGPDGRPDALDDLRREAYGGRAFANALARRGFAVLCHDVFLWGSRRFPPEVMRADEPPRDIAGYNQLAAAHEHVVAKYCTVLGTSLPAVVAYEDRVAVAYLRGRPDVATGPIGCVGLSGGGCRAALLQATCDHVGAAVIAGMMTTHPALLDRHVAAHTWMFFPPGLARVGDWPDLAASRAPSPLLVQYLRDDALFPLAGMQAADQRLTERYAAAGAPDAYVGEWYPGPHRFDVAIQEAAFAHLARWLDG